jgi:hypothetical protein
MDYEGTLMLSEVGKRESVECGRRSDQAARREVGFRIRPSGE